MSQYSKNDFLPSAIHQIGFPHLTHVQVSIITLSYDLQVLQKTTIVLK